MNSCSSKDHKSTYRRDFLLIIYKNKIIYFLMLLVNTTYGSLRCHTLTTLPVYVVLFVRTNTNVFV